MVELLVEAMLAVDGEQIAHLRDRLCGTVLRVISIAEVKSEYANGIFSHMHLDDMVVELENDAKLLS